MALSATYASVTGGKLGGIMLQMAAPGKALDEFMMDVGKATGDTRYAYYIILFVHIIRPYSYCI